MNVRLRVEVLGLDVSTAVAHAGMPALLAAGVGVLDMVVVECSVYLMVFDCVLLQTWRLKITPMRRMWKCAPNWRPLFDRSTNPPC